MVDLAFLQGKRVLLVSHELSLTGAPLLLVEVGRALVRAGAEVSFVNLGWQDACFPTSLLTSFSLSSADNSMDEAARADLILANTAVAKVWVRQLLAMHPDAARRLIWWIHEIHTNWFGAEMECLGQAAVALFDSHACLTTWQEFGCPMPATTRVIHPCVEDEFAEGANRLAASGQALRQSIRQELGVGPDDLLLALFGTYHPRKGQDALVKTIGHMLEREPRLPLKLLLVGFATEVARLGLLQRLTASESLALTPARALPYTADLKPCYLASDALVMNSDAPGEPFGRVTIEAMAFRLPVLGCVMGGTAEIVLHGITGWLHSAGDVGQVQLAKNIRDLLENRIEGFARGEAGCQRMRARFSASRFYHELADVLRTLVETALPSKGCAGHGANARRSA